MCSAIAPWALRAYSRWFVVGIPLVLATFPVHGAEAGKEKRLPMDLRLGLPDDPRHRSADEQKNKLRVSVVPLACVARFIAKIDSGLIADEAPCCTLQVVQELWSYPPVTDCLAVRAANAGTGAMCREANPPAEVVAEVVDWELVGLLSWSQHPIVA